VPIKSLTPLRSMSKSREVFERLRDAIWSGDLAPGVPLRESHLAKQLNVSQVPVREALLQLENLGLVVRVPDRGTTVTKLSRPEILQMMEVRRHLEEYAFHLAASRMDADVEAELRAHLTEMKKLVSKKDHFGVAEQDFMFHQTVWKASGNEVLEKTLQRLCIAVYAFVSLKRHAANEAMQSAVRKHTLLLEALLTRDEDHIRNQIQEHLTPEAALPDYITE
jgi:DNA-binding GntR family transcriptional regulator